MEDYVNPWSPILYGTSTPVTCRWDSFLTNKEGQCHCISTTFRVMSSPFYFTDTKLTNFNLIDDHYRLRFITIEVVLLSNEERVDLSSVLLKRVPKHSETTYHSLKLRGKQNNEMICFGTQTPVVYQISSFSSRSLIQTKS